MQAQTITRFCSVEGCTRPLYGRGLCTMHYVQAKRGKREFPLPSRFLPRTASPEDRFWRMVEKTETCWLWTGAVMKNGYGVFDKGLAHQFLAGKAPSGLEWDHLCFVRNCVRPEHLEAVSRAENIRRQRTKGPAPKASCINGHPFEGSNLRILPDGKKACRICTREAMRRFRTRHRTMDLPRAPRSLP